MFWSRNMNVKDKPREKYELIKNFALLIKPLEDSAKRQPIPDIESYKIAVGQVNNDIEKFMRMVQKFVVFPNANYNNEYGDIYTVYLSFNSKYRNKLKVTKLENPKEFQDEFKEDLVKFDSSFYQIIDSIPIDWHLRHFEEKTPFTAHLGILDCISEARSSLVYIDRYLKPNFFKLYLRDLDRSISIRLLTTKISVADILDVSELCRQEFSDYKLIKFDPKDYHDRTLRVDNKVFNIGSGICEAGIKSTTFGPGPNTLEYNNEIDDLITNGIKNGQLVHESKP